MPREMTLDNLLDATEDVPGEAKFVIWVDDKWTDDVSLEIRNGEIHLMGGENAKSESTS